MYPGVGGVAGGAGVPGAGFGYSPAYVAPGGFAGPALVNGRRILGIDEEPVVLRDGRKAMKITNVYANTGAANAGLQVGDVLISANGYLTEQRGNLAWIIGNATPGREMKLVVRTLKDGKDHTVMASI
jgi:S1-C subfamily serine protease